MSARACGRAGDSVENSTTPRVENSTTLRLASENLSAAELLGLELTRLRLNKGLSLRRLARLVRMTAHSGLVDYERGTRIPPDDLLTALVAALQPGSDRLVPLHRAAIAERAQRRLAVTIRSAHDAPAPGPELPAREPPRQQDDPVALPAPDSGQDRCTRCGPALDAAADTLEQLARSLRYHGSSSRSLIVSSH